MAIYQGTVKSFNTEKCYGFLVSPQVSGDVMFGRTDVPEHLKSSRLVGCEVNFTVSESQGKGLRVAAMEFVSMPAMTSMGSQGGLTYTGKVKSFNPSKGFGFIMSPQVPGDVMFGKNEIPDALRMAELNGCEVTFDLSSDSSKGLRALKVQFNSAMAAASPVMMNGGQLGGMPSPCMGGTYGMGNMAMGGCGMGGMGGMTGMGQAAAGMGMGSGMQSLPLAGGTEIGEIKSFNGSYGFIKTDTIDSVYFKPTDLAALSPQQIFIGTRVSFELVYHKDGKPQAKNVRPAAASSLKRSAVTAFGGAGIMDMVPTKRASSIVSEGSMLSGTIYSFRPATPPDPKKGGFGFLKCPELAGDVWFSQASLPVQIQFSPNIASIVGQTVRFVLKIKPDGKMAADSIII